jgi:hypothetical protein
VEVEMNDQQSDSNNNILVTDSIPYVLPHAVDTNTSIISDDARSTGCVSHESDAGWSEAYTSSMGSVSDNDDEISFKSNHNDHDLSEGPVPAITTPTTTTTTTTDEGGDNILGLLSIALTTTMNNTENIPPPDESITTTTTTPMPKSPIGLLEDVFENDDEIVIHEDFSYEDLHYDYDNNNNNNSNNNSTPHNNNNVRSPEEFRSEVYALIERVIPEEIDQADDMIAQFIDREDELLQTLVAMGKRASAQQQKEEVDRSLS